MSRQAALQLLGGLLLEDGKTWGRAAASWQREDAEAILDDESATTSHFCSRSRGSSKTTDLAGIGLAVLLEQAPPQARCYAFASDEDQAGLLLDALRGLVVRTVGISGAVKVEARRVLVPRTGASLEVMPADAASTWGLRPYFAVVDELSSWRSTARPREVWEAVVSAMPKTPGARLVVLTTAGDPAHWSAKVRDQAIAQPRWRVHEVPGPCPWITPEALAEQRALLPESSYRRLHLNEWVEAEDGLTTVDDVRACMGGDSVVPPVLGERYVVGLDLGVREDRTAMAICHAVAEPEGTTIVLDRLETWTPTKGRQVDLTTVEETVLRANFVYNKAGVVLDPWQGMALAQRLRAKRVQVHEFTFSQASVGRLALTLYRLLRDHRLDLPDDEELADELANVRLRETAPGQYRMDHDPGRHDDRAIALALAAQYLLDRPPQRRLGRVWSADGSTSRDRAESFVGESRLRGYVESGAGEAPGMEGLRDWLRGR